MTKPKIPNLDSLVRPADYQGQVVTLLAHPNRRVLSATIWVYAYLGWHIYDADLWYVCADCGESTQAKLVNIAPEDVSAIAAMAGTELYVGNVADPSRLTWDVEDGAWSPEGQWVEYPVYQLEIKDLEQEERREMKRRENQTIKLAQWFVENILTEYDPSRVWTTNDYRSAHTKHAKALLGRHSLREICGCAEAARDGLIGDGLELRYLSMIESTGEPPLISQYQSYLETPPAVYLESAYADWQARKDRTYDELDVSARLSVPEGGEVRPENWASRRSGLSEYLDSDQIPELD